MVENEEEMKSKEVEKEIFRKKKKYDCKKQMDVEMGIELFENG